MADRVPRIVAKVSKSLEAAEQSPQWAQKGAQRKRAGKLESVRAEAVPESAESPAIAHEAVSGDVSPAAKGRPATARPGGFEFEVEEVYDEGDRQLEAVEDGETVIPAWYGSYSSRISQEQLRRGLFHESIIEPDGRVRIPDTTRFPFSAICYLQIRSAMGPGFRGTGWFVSDRLILTAGHNVFIHGSGGWATEILVIPARDGNSEPFGRQVVSKSGLRSVGGWVNEQNQRFDYGAIILPTPFDGIDRFFKINTSRPVEGANLNVTGYPFDKPGFNMWWHGEKAVDVDEFQIHYRIDTAGGNSGGPCYIREGGATPSENDDRTAVGIHVAGSPAGNVATRITPAVKANIDMWLQQAGG